MEKFKKLSRTDMRKVTGGTYSSCTAKCGTDKDNKPITVTCGGDDCTATDCVGCTSKSETKNCPGDLA